MIESTTFSPPHPMVFVGDIGGQIPELDEGSLVSWNDTCLIVTCWSEDYSGVEIVLGTAQEVDPGVAPAFAGMLKTPTRRIRVLTSHNETILQMSVPNEQTHVQIWPNHPRLPDRVIIGVA